MPTFKSTRKGKKWAYVSLTTRCYTTSIVSSSSFFRFRPDFLTFFAHISDFKFLVLNKFNKTIIPFALVGYLPSGIILKYYVCVILIAIFLEDLFVPTVIQYEGAKRYMKLSSEGKARHVYEMCHNKQRQDISWDTWAVNEHFW